MIISKHTHTRTQPYVYIWFTSLNCLKYLLKTPNDVQRSVASSNKSTAIRFVDLKRKRYSFPLMVPNNVSRKHSIFISLTLTKSRFLVISSFWKSTCRLESGYFFYSSLVELMVFYSTRAPSS